MNKMKKLLPILVTLILLLTMAVPAQAETEAVDVEVKSGSLEAKVVFTIDKVLALEGTVSTNARTGFKVSEMDLTFSKYDGTEPAMTEIQNEGGQGKVIFIGANTPTDLKLAVVLKSDSPMRNGIYDVVLNYGRTANTGTYSPNGKLVAKIYVGIDMPKDDDKDSGDDSTSSDSTTATTVVEEAEVIENDPVLEEVEEEGSNRVGMLGMLETYELRSALEEAEKLKEHGGWTAAEMSMLQEAIDAGEEALMDDRQSVVDEATYNLHMVIEELGGPIEEQEEEDSSERSGRGLSLPIILAVVAAVAAVAAVVAGYLLKKKKKTSYDGAPDVDYNIGDDDEA